MDLLNHIRYGVELERAQMPNNGLNESPGWWNSLWGSISGATQEGVDNKRSAVGNADANRYLEGQGYTREQLGIDPNARLTTGGAISRINTYLEDKADAKSTTAFERSLVPLTKQLEATAEANRLQLQAQGRQLEAQLASQTNNLQAQMANNNAQFAFTSKENNLNRRHERELADGRNDLSLQISLMQNDLADKRMQYDRETRQMDRRDRAIAQLMEGLGQLGGAFAL